MKRGVFILLVFMCFISSIIISTSTSAGNLDIGDDDDTSGSGSTGSKWDSSDCVPHDDLYGAFRLTNVKYCGDYGGVSWHIFKIKDKDNNQNKKIYTIDELKSGTEPNKNRLNKITNDQRPVLDKSELKKEYQTTYATCDQFYVTYVYDGWYNYPDKKTSLGSDTPYKPIYYGPLAWKEVKSLPSDPGGKTHYPIYNRKNGANWTATDMLNEIKKGVNVNGRRLNGSCTWSNNNTGCKPGTYKSSAADELYKKWKPNSSKVPSGTGWFCIPKSLYRLFEGMSQVKDHFSNTWESTGWVGENKTVTLYINNCSSTTGCKAIFEHHIKKVNTPHNYTSDYVINRTSNFPYNSVLDKGINSNTNLYRGSSAGGRVQPPSELTLYPGMIVCESMNFKVDNQGNRATTTACALALGTVKTDIDIQVKNIDNPDYNTFQKEVYAKPEDKLIYKATYNPILQYTAKLRPDQMQINSEKITIQPAVFTLQSLFNNQVGSDWNNAFNVKSANFAVKDVNQDYIYPVGDTTTRIEVEERNFASGPLNHQVKVDSYSETGKSLDETAKVSETPATQTTPSQVVFSNNNGSLLANVIYDPQAQATAHARVPYNFETATKISDSNDPYFYAGEQTTIDFDFTVKSRYNSVTKGTYATKVKGAKKRLRVCIKSPINMCQFTTPEPLGSEGDKKDEIHPNLKGETTFGNQKISFNVPDVPAGTIVCLQSMIWPKDSGDERNIEVSGYNPDWSVSEEDAACFTVAKKPNIQLWGGNVYSAGNITTKVAKKSLLAGHNFTRNNYNPNPTSPQWVFGSFGELGLIATGQVTGLASGASTGYATHDNIGIDDIKNYGLWPSTHPSNGWGNINGSRDSGGSKTNNFCKHSPLSFANDKCSNSGVGNLASNNNLTKADGDKQKIINNLAVPSDRLDQKYIATDGFTINGKEDSHITSNGSYYYYSSSDTLNFAGGTIGRGTTQMVHSKNDITITGNISYDTSAPYSKLYDIPNLIIYAEGNITIDCGVAQLDALIIAEKSVNTCDSGDINADVNSNQLVINGAVVAGNLIANRTYGAGIGNNSIIPAEIINFNPALYLWNATNIDEDKNENKNEIKDLDTVKLTEVAPRY